MKIRYTLLFPLLLALTPSACKSSRQTSAEPAPVASTSTLALALPPPTGPTVSCLNLPPKERVQMQLGKDRKTVYYFEVTREFHASAEAKSRYALVALDVETRTTKVIDDNVGLDTVVTQNGQIVFARSDDGSAEYKAHRRLYIRDPNQAQPILLSDKKGKDVGAFIVDEKSSSVIYEDDSKIYRVPFAGGAPKKVADGWRVDAVLEQGMLVRQLFDRLNLVRFDGKKGKEFKIKDGETFAGVNSGYMIIVGEDLALQALPIENNDPKAKKELPLDRGIKGLFWGGLQHAEQVVARYGKDNRVFRVQGPDVKKIFTATGANIGDYAELESGTKVVLACHDTHGDGGCGHFDESDVCIIERAANDDVVDIPTRKVPTPLKEASEKLAILTTSGDWAGARIEYYTREDGGYRVHFDSLGEGAANEDELRARARALQTRVTELSGVPTISVGIRFANGFTSGTRWHDGTKRFYSHAGMGSSELTDVKEYPLEIETTIVTGWDSSTCRGKLKNISDKPLENLTIECSPEVSYGPPKAPGRAKMSPPTLAPGVEGQFMTSNFDYSQYRSDGVRVIVKQGEQAILPYNRYAAKKSQERWKQAVSLYNATGLAYFQLLNQNGSTVAQVLAAPAFKNLDKAEQEKNCAKAIDEMVKLKLLEKSRTKKVILKIHDPAVDRFRWSYQDGQLSEIAE